MTETLLISSSQNQWIKKAQQLKQKKYRQSEGLFLLEGIRLLEEFCLSDWDGLYGFYVKPLSERGELLLQSLQRKGLTLYETTPDLLKKVSETENPQGFVVVAKQQLHSLTDSLEQASLLVLLDGLQDPGNVGTLIRTCDAAGVGGVILHQSADLYNSKTIRACMGSLFHIPILEVQESSVILGWLKQKEFTLYATSLGDDSVPYDQADYSQRCALILGSEGHGVSQALLDEAQTSLHIPLYGQAESLNVAVAGGILMYEALRQRRLTCQRA